MVAVVEPEVEDIVEKADMEGDQVVQVDMEDALADRVVVDIVEVLVDHLVVDIEVDHLEDTRVDHLEDTRVDQADHHLVVDIVETQVDLDDIRADHHHEMVEDTLEVDLLVVDHLGAVADIVDLLEVDLEGAIRKIGHLAQVKADIATIVTAMVDHLEVRHNKKEAKASFLL
jgi:hypothetical protein